jgi:short-subunit dehydrogenase
LFRNSFKTNNVMRGLKKKYGNTALVAGSSEGLGAAYCHALAAEGFELVMIARGKEKLEAQAAEIRIKYKVKVTAIAADLADPDIIGIIQAQIGALNIDMLVYDAGMPYIGPFTDAPLAKHLAIASVNMLGPLRLSYHFGSSMVERRRGAVILMTSISGFQGAGFLTTYSSTKAFNRQLAESLWYEWKDKGVDVIACCGGTIATPNYLNTKPEKSLIAPAAEAPEAVVAECLDKLGKTPSFVAGMGNKMATFFLSHFIPRKMAINLMGDTTRKMYRINY